MSALTSDLDKASLHLQFDKAVCYLCVVETPHPTKVKVELPEQLPLPVPQPVVKEEESENPVLKKAEVEPSAPPPPLVVGVAQPAQADVRAPLPFLNPKAPLPADKLLGGSSEEDDEVLCKVCDTVVAKTAACSPKSCSTPSRSSAVLQEKPLLGPDAAKPFKVPRRMSSKTSQWRSDSVVSRGW